MSGWLTSGLVNNLQNITDQITNLTKDFVNEISSASQDEGTDVKDEVLDLKSRIDLLERECIRLNHENTVLKQQGMEAASCSLKEVSEKEVQVTEFEKSIVTCKVDVSVSTDECNTADEQISNLTSENQKLSSELAILKSHHEEFKTEHEVQVKRLKDRLHEVQNQSASMIASVHEKYESEIMKLQGNTSDYNSLHSWETVLVEDENKELTKNSCADKSAETDATFDLTHSLPYLNMKLDNIMSLLFDHSRYILMGSNALPEDHSDDVDFELCEIAASSSSLPKLKDSDGGDGNIRSIESSFVHEDVDVQSSTEKYAQYIKSEAYIIELERAIHQMIDKIIELMYGEDDDLLIPVDGENALELLNYAEMLITNATDTNAQTLEKLTNSVYESKAEAEKLRQESSSALTQLNMTVQEYRERCELLEELMHKNENVVAGQTETIESEPWECIAASKASNNTCDTDKPAEINNDIAELLREKELCIRNLTEEINLLRSKNEQFQSVCCELERIKELNNVLEKKLDDLQYYGQRKLCDERDNEVTDHELAQCNIDPFPIGGVNLQGSLNERQEACASYTAIVEEQSLSSYTLEPSERQSKDEECQVCLTSFLTDTKLEFSSTVDFSLKSLNHAYAYTQTDDVLHVIDVIDKTKCKCEVYESENKMLLAENETLKQQTEAAEIEKQEMEKKLIDKHKELTAVKAEVVEKDEGFSRLALFIGESDSENFEQIIMNVEKFVNEKIRQNEESLRTINTLKSAVSGRETKEKALREQITELNANRIQLNEVKMSLEKEVEKYKEDLATTNEKLKKRDWEHDQLCDIKEKLGQELLRLKNESEQLKMHLRNIEENATLESLEAVENEEKLKRRIKQLTDDVQAIQLAHNASEEELRKALGIALDESQRWQRELTSCKTYLAKLTEEYTQQNIIAGKMKSTLDHFKSERDKEFTELCIVHEQEIAKLIDEIEGLKNANELLTSSSVDNEKLREVTKTQAEKLTVMDRDLCSLRHELNVKEERIKLLEGTVRTLSPVSDSQIEKSLMKNMLLCYFRTSTDKRTQALLPMCALLGFDANELEEITSLESGGWLKNWSSPKKHLRLKSDSSAANQSFIQLFIQYIEQESAADSRSKVDKDSLSRPEEESNQPALRLPSMVAKIAYPDEKDSCHERQE